MELLIWKIVLLLTAAVFVQAFTTNEVALPSFGDQDQLEVRAAVGRDAVFTCTVRNIMHYQTAWLQMKKGIVYAMGDDVFTENPRITVHHSLTLDGEEAWVLTIKNVNLNDTGYYMCSLNTQVSLRKYYHLSVVVPPKILDSNTSTDTEVQEGDEVRLFCGASGKPDPTYKWRREDSKLIDAFGKTELMVGGSELVISNVLREHAGAYLCIASNGVLPSVSKRILLSVKFQPMMRATSSQAWVTLGSTVNLSCVVDAFPEPTMLWVRDFGETVTSQAYVYHLQDGTVEVMKYDSGVQHLNSSRWILYLTIRDIQEMDLFGYRCRANNSQGVAEASVSVFKITPSTTSTTTTTTTTTTTSTTTTTIPVTTVTRHNGDGLLIWVPGPGKNDTAAGAIEGQLGGLQKQQQQQQQQEQQQQQQQQGEQWKQQYGRKTFTYSTGNAASCIVVIGQYSLLLLLLLLQDFLLH